MRHKCNRCHKVNTNLFYRQGTCLSSNNLLSPNKNVASINNSIMNNYMSTAGSLSPRISPSINNSQNIFSNSFDGNGGNNNYFRSFSPVFAHNNSNSLNNNFNMNFSMNNSFEKNKNSRKPFIERAGDWVCHKCNNLNFAFRTNCNRCHLTKSENLILFQQQMRKETEQ